MIAEVPRSEKPAEPILTDREFRIFTVAEMRRIAAWLHEAEGELGGLNPARRIVEQASARVADLMEVGQR